MSGYKERARVKAIEARNELGIGQLDSINIFKLLKNRENISIINKFQTQFGASVFYGCSRILPPQI